MKIIIPFTGEGSRFVASGYERLKPFILIFEKPIIQWIIQMFGEQEQKNIIFITRKDHVKKYPYIEQTLQQISPNSKVIILDNAEKTGPVGNIMRIQEYIPDFEEVVVSYCDYYMQWDWSKFKQDVVSNQCDGSIVCYSGFHPHLISKNNVYASCKVDNNDNLIEIKEKFSWTEDKTKSRHSPGLYYFKTGALLKKYYQKLINDNNNINGEFYCSLPYNYMVEDGLKVWCPVNIEKFCQWGTPRDMEEFLSFNKGWNV
jgi:NDP-sugar pyrophosphorylase family protein